MAMLALKKIKKQNKKKSIIHHRDVVTLISIQITHECYHAFSVLLLLPKTVG